MSQNISQLEAIIELLHLKRQHHEAQLSQSKRQDERLGAEIKALQHPYDGLDQHNYTRLDIAVVTAKWDGWRIEKIEKLQNERLILSQTLNAQTKALKALWVQIETLTCELEGLKRQIIQGYVNAQSNQRLEVWTAARSA